jgi:hypothetical protein
MHLVCNASVAIAAFVLLEDIFDLITFITVFVCSVSESVQMIIEYGTCHPLGFQQDAEVIFQP